MNKPRNWYIHQWEDLAQADFAWRNEEVLNRELEIHTKYVNMGYRPKGEVIEVVEKSAHEEALVKIAELEKENKNLKTALTIQREVCEAINDNGLQAFRLQQQTQTLNNKIKLLEEVNQKLIKALEDIKIRLQYSQHTNFPIYIRELDGSISQQRSKTNEGHAYDLANDVLESVKKKMEEIK